MSFEEHQFHQHFCASFAQMWANTLLLFLNILRAEFLPIFFCQIGTIPKMLVQKDACTTFVQKATRKMSGEIETKDEELFENE